VVDRLISSEVLTPASAVLGFLPDSPVVIGAAVLGVVVGVALHLLSSQRLLRQAREAAARERDEATQEVDRIVAGVRREIEGEYGHWMAEFASERREIEERLEELESVLADRETDLERRSQAASERSDAIDEKKREIRHLKSQKRRRERHLRRMQADQTELLLERAGMTEEAAREMILGMIGEDVGRDQRNRFGARLELLQDDVEKVARRVVSIAIARCGIQHEDNGFSGSVTLPNKSFRNRLVGKDGENQRAFEELTGVHLVFDDEDPLSLVLSAYDGMKKAIARRTIEKLVSQNSPIQPARIQELVEKSTREMKKIMLDTGRKVCSSFRIKGVHPEIQGLLGRLNYRSSYGQNVLKHSKEVAFLSSTIAAEIGLDARLTKRCGLLHDIGKAVDAEIEGGHPEIGAEIATRCKEKQPVIDAIALHHEDPDKIGMFPLLTQSADAISGSRPGARRETLERYLKHLEELEAIGQGADGVDTAYAIQAGRELRVFVDPKKVDDDRAAEICRAVTAQVEESLTYPGKIKVTVVRESRTAAFAR